MSKNRFATVATYGLLALTCGLTFMMPRTLTVPSTEAAVPPPKIVLNGIIRDFAKSHTDFGAAPALGYGHYAANISTLLPGTHRPIFVDGGYKIEREWTDVRNRPIAPHLAGVRGSLTRKTMGLHIQDTIDLRKNTSIDGFNSNYGPYGVLGNFGRNAVLSTNSVASQAVTIHKKAFVRGDIFVGPGGVPADVIANEGVVTGALGNLTEAYEMPVLVPPDDLEPYQRVLTVNSPVTWTGDLDPEDDVDVPAMYVGDLRLVEGAIVTVEGDLRVRCDRSLTIDRAEIVLLPDAVLTIYVSNLAGGTGNVAIRGNSLINVDPGDTTRVSINALGPGRFHIGNKSHVYATLTAPQRAIVLRDEANFYGGLIAQSLAVEKRSAVHVDLGNADPGPSNFACSVQRKVNLYNHCVIDSFDSNNGPYGPGNQGEDAWVSTNSIRRKWGVHVRRRSAIMGNVLIGPNGDVNKVVRVDRSSSISGDIGRLAAPYAIPIVAPPGLGPSVGDVIFNDGSVHVLSTDLHCHNLKVTNRSSLVIDGDVTVRADRNVRLANRSQILLNPNSTLTLYVKNEMKVYDRCSVNMNTGNPQLVSVRMLSLGRKTRVEVSKKSKMAAWTMGAKSVLSIQNQSEYFGSFTGKKVRLRKHSMMHVDMANLRQCANVLDTPGLKGTGGSGGITSAATFDQWFRALPGVNQTMGYPITLTRSGSVWEYLDNAFHPVDDRLLGNEGEPHNNYFTYAVRANFRYEKCGGQFVEFKGGDGVWIFIDGKLVIDLGGMRAPQAQYIDLDRLGLDDGKRYDFDLFYAQRQALDSIFRFRTNIDLESQNAIPSVTAMFD